MLVEFSVQNFTSFNTLQTFSMSASSTPKEDFNEQNTFSVNKFGIKKLIKTAAIFGPNAGGKSNFIASFRNFKKIVLKSISSAEDNLLQTITPFLVKEAYFDIPTEFEVIFLHEEALYRYGIAIKAAKITEEWLYWHNTECEMMLFHRVGQEIAIDKNYFSEAIDFVKEANGKFYVEKTRETIPFLSVVSTFDGEKSRQVTEWFKKVHVLSGIEEDRFRGFTMNLIKQDLVFKSWLLDIVKSLQIQDIKITEILDRTPFDDIDTGDDKISELLSNIDTLMKKNKIKGHRVEIIKKSESSEKEYTIPFSLESDGTKKLIYLLGPIYDVIQKGEILFIDEFDTKFHSLLSKFVLEIYHQSNQSHSQAIITSHDTNLLTKALFRRDQIWFVEKNAAHETELYSLLEYKEHYTRKGDAYSKDYLLGKYGAVPLFESIDKLIETLDG